MTEPSAATIRIIPSDRPAARKRSSSAASVGSNVPGANTFRAAVVVDVVVEAAAVVDDATGSVRLLGRDFDDEVDDDEDEHAASSSTNAADAAAHRDAAHAQDLIGSTPRITTISTLLGSGRPSSHTRARHAARRRVPEPALRGGRPPASS
jgi:hypothetical protein